MENIPEHEEFTNELLKKYYPTKGLKWCCEHFQVPNWLIRSRAEYYRIKVDKNSKEFKKRFEQATIDRIKKITGRKRPAQAEVMKRLHREGKLLKNEAQKKAISVRVKKWLTTHKHPRGMFGKHHSEITKEKLKVSLKKTMDNMPIEKKTERIKKILMTKFMNGVNHLRKNATWKAGKSEDLGDIYFRSSWERNYARYLNFLITKNLVKSWTFEKKIFWFEKIKRGCVSYKPDFEVIMPDGEIQYHEVKGWMDDKSLTKIKRMRIYHPKVKLIVIDKPAYKELAKNGKFFSKYWE
jgi:hypothetical protein